MSNQNQKLSNLSGASFVDARRNVIAADARLSNFNSVQFSDVEIILPSEWIYVTASGFLNSWTNYTTAPDASNAAYVKHENGIVEVKGRIKNGTAGLAAFALPTSLRPDSDKSFATNIGAGSGNGWFSISASNGYVIPYGSGAASDSVINGMFKAKNGSYEPSSPPFPIFVRLDRNETPKGVFVAKNEYDDPNGNSSSCTECNSVCWDTVSSRTGNRVTLRIKGIAGLYHGARNIVRLMIVW